MVSHRLVKAVIHQCIGDISSSGEDLIQMSNKLVGDSVRVEGMSEAEEKDLTVHVVDVIVEISTNDHHCSRILLDDILDDICQPLRSLHLELLFARFEVAVQYLHLISPSCQPHPAEVRPQRFHQRQLHSVRCCYPTSTIPLQQCLVRPEVVQIYWNCQLGLIQADQMGIFRGE